MQVVVLAMVLIVLALLFEALEGFAWSVPRLRTRWRTDVAWWFFGPLVADPLVRAGIAVALAVPVVALGIAGPDLVEGRGPLARLPTIVQLPLVLIVGDLVAYWMHRLHHRSRLWRLHAVHHSSEHVDWLASVRVHPLNELVQRAPGALVLVLMGFDLAAVGAAMPIVAIYAIGLHANVPWRFGPLRFVLASPAFHRWHHATTGPAGGCNFAGLLPVWDLLFGTFHLPEQAPREFGVLGEPVPDGFFAQLTFPLRAPRRAP